MKFYFEKPGLERKEEAFEYLEEHIKYNSKNVPDQVIIRAD